MFIVISRGTIKRIIEKGITKMLVREVKWNDKKKSLNNPKKEKETKTGGYNEK